MHGIDVDTGACAFILKNRLPDRWQDAREDTGQNAIDGAEAVRALIGDLYEATEASPPNVEQKETVNA